MDNYRQSERTDADVLNHKLCGFYGLTLYKHNMEH